MLFGTFGTSKSEKYLSILSFFPSVIFSNFGFFGSTTFLTTSTSNFGATSLITFVESFFLIVIALPLETAAEYKVIVKAALVASAIK